MRFIEVNRAAVDHYGYTQEEFLSMTLADIRPPEDVPSFLTVVNTFGDTPIRAEWRHILKDGRRISVEISAYQVDLFGQSAILSLVQDITERKKAEQELGRYVQHLARTNSDLQQFAYAASHDLAEPIRMITTQTQLFERHFGRQVSAQAHEYLQFAREGAVRMGLLVNALREYWEVQQRTLDVKPVPLGAVVQEMASRMSPAVEEAHASITSEELPTVQADELLLLSLFCQLIDNALKFRSGEPPRIHVSAVATDAYYTISIHDNGIGIERQYSERVFRIFHRLSRQYPGVGIGLSLCKQIMERHDGAFGSTHSRDSGRQ